MLPMRAVVTIVGRHVDDVDNGDGIGDSFGKVC